MYAEFLHTKAIILQSETSIFNIYYMAIKKKNFHRQETLARKNAIQSLEFLISFGLKQMDAENTFRESADVELKEIIELDLCRDLLGIQKLIDSIRLRFNENVIEGKGDLCDSCVCVALGISRVNDIHSIIFEYNRWKKLLEQKFVSIYYPNEIRNSIVAWAGENGYITSTYLGQPIIKFNKLFLSIKRTY